MIQYFIWNKGAFNFYYFPFIRFCMAIRTQVPALFEGVGVANDSDGVYLNDMEKNLPCGLYNRQSDKLHSLSLHISIGISFF